MDFRYGFGYGSGFSSFDDWLRHTVDSTPRHNLNNQWGFGAFRGTNTPEMGGVDQMDIDGMSEMDTDTVTASSTSTDTSMGCVHSDSGSEAMDVDVDPDDMDIDEEIPWTEPFRTFNFGGTFYRQWSGSFDSFA